jgi:hypothetical protein
MWFQSLQKFQSIFILGEVDLDIQENMLLTTITNSDRCQWSLKYPLGDRMTDGLVITNMEDSYGEIKSTSRQLYTFLKHGWENPDVSSCLLRIPTQGELNLIFRNSQKEELVNVLYKNVQTNIYHHAIEVDLKKIRPFLEYRTEYHRDGLVTIKFNPTRPMEMYIGSHIVVYIAPIEDNPK